LANTVIIVGLPQALAKIAAIPLIAEKMGQVGLDVGKVHVADKARQLVPKRTGALAASIVAVPEGVAVGERYAGFVEFGTRNMRAQAYLGPALEAEDEAVSDLVSNTVRAALYAL
jgi:HK97 gp10 family phage protein